MEIKIIVLVLLLVGYLLEQILAYLNLQFMKKNKDKRQLTFPKILQEKISDSDYERAISYGEHNFWLNFIVASINWILLSIVIYYSLFNKIDLFVRELPAPRVMFCLVIFLIVQFLSLPSKAISVFFIEERFGFNNTDLKTFFLDFFKGLVLSLLIMSPLLWALFAFYDWAGSWWWLIAYVLFITVQFFLLIIYPLIIAPIFNKFTPLKDSELSEAIKNLAHKIKFPMSSIMVMDGSRRTGHSNAYFTGIGKTKRVVIYDTLLKSLSKEQMLAVLGHEFGHYKLLHIRKRMIFSFVMAFISFFLLDKFLHAEMIFTALGYEVKVHIALILFSLLFSFVDIILAPVFNYFSRKHEYAADKYAADKVEGGSIHLAESLVKLNKDNLSNPMPHPLYSIFYYSHPPIVERLKALQ